MSGEWETTTPPPPGWSAGAGDPPWEHTQEPDRAHFTVGDDAPEYWAGHAGGELRRTDGVLLRSGVATHPPEARIPGLEAEIGWWARLPLKPGNQPGDFVAVFLRVPTASVAMRVVDTLYPPPAFIRIPDGWLVDVPTMRGTKVVLIRPLEFDDWTDGLRMAGDLVVSRDTALDVLCFTRPGAIVSAVLFSRLQEGAIVFSRKGYETCGQARPVPDLTHRETVALLLERGLVRTVFVPIGALPEGARC